MKVTLSNETILLSLNQLSIFFKRDKSTVSRHISSIFDSEELDEDSVVADVATTASEK